MLAFVSIREVPVTVVTGGESPKLAPERIGGAGVVSWCGGCPWTCAAPELRALQCRYQDSVGFRGSVGLAVRTLGERSQSAAQLLMVWHPVSGP